MAFGPDVSGRSVLSVKDTIYESCYANALIMAAIKGLFTNFLLSVCLATLERPIVTFPRDRYRSFACKKLAMSFVRIRKQLAAGIHSNLFVRSQITQPRNFFV
jgi:hypothetical protein